MVAFGILTVCEQEFSYRIVQHLFDVSFESFYGNVSYTSNTRFRPLANLFILKFAKVSFDPQTSDAFLIERKQEEERLGMSF